MQQSEEQKQKLSQEFTEKMKKISEINNLIENKDSERNKVTSELSKVDSEIARLEEKIRGFDSDF